MRLLVLKLTVALSLILLVEVPTAWADLYAAQIAYKKSDFVSAFKQFKELAELGQPRAQYDLAVLYARGEGVERSATYAHAWASLSVKNGMVEAEKWVAELEPQISPMSLKISAEIQAKYSQAALDKSLMPRFLKGREYENTDPVRPSNHYMPAYPDLARRAGIQGEVYVEFVVPPDGHPRMPRILYAVPTGSFEETVRDSVLRSLYLPARRNGQPVTTTVSMLYNFQMRGVSIEEYGDLKNRVRATELKAEAGDVSAQMLYGMMLAGLPQLKQSADKAMPWFLKAAQAGAPYAQYQIGTRLLNGQGCQCDAVKGEIWLQKAAQSDQPDAQVTLAEYLLKGNPDHEAIKGAIVWLERAAKQDSKSGKLLLAAVLAANPAVEFRDPKRALTLTENLEREHRNDPSLWEIRAAANASQGDYKAAAKQQSRAIDQARRLGWDMEPLEKRQALYVAQQAWSGNLLTF